MKEPYIILSSTSGKFELEKLVRNKISDGYIPCGGVSIAMSYNPNSGNVKEYCQAMILK